LIKVQLRVKEVKVKIIKLLKVWVLLIPYTKLVLKLKLFYYGALSCYGFIRVRLLPIC